MEDQYGRGKVKYWRWTDGRQGSGYKIFYMWNWKFDFLFIRYPEGSYINWHNDPVPAPLKHHRINIVLREAEGGMFEYKHVDSHVSVVTKARFVYFRPDVMFHKVWKIVKGERWVLSIGWCTK